MKRAGAALLVLLALVAWALWPRSAPEPGEPAVEVPAAQLNTAAASRAPEAQPPARPLEKRATAQDGAVEIRVSAGGKPLGGAEVRLYLRGRTDPNTQRVDWQVAGSAVSGADGVARIAALPGTYLASARARGLAPARHELQRPLGEAVTRVSLELKAPVSLEGRTVQKGNGEAVPLAVLTLTPGRGDAPVEEQATATSDARGLFRFDGLAPGSLRLTARATGYATGSLRTDAPAKELQLALAPAAFIEGFVTEPDGKPASGAEVQAVGGQEMATATATSTGSFSLEVAPRSWDVSARRGDEAGRSDKPVVVAAGATARGVRIVLGAAGSIAGTVVAAGGGKQPIEGALIDVSPRGHNGDSGRAVTDAHGAFAVGGLPPGSYDVVASAQGYSRTERMGVSMGAGQRYPLQLELHSTGALEGFVRDASGRAVAYALVRSVRGTGLLPEARSDSSGAYRLAGLEAGRSVFSAARDEATLGAQAVAEIPESGTAHLDFQLADEGVLTGKVRRKDGSPPPADTIVRVFSQARPFGTGATLPMDASGGFLGSLPSGNYSLTASPQGNFAAPRDRVTVAVEAGHTTTQDLTLPDPPAHEGTGFSGVVTEPDGSPSPGAVVRGIALNQERNFVFGATADELGRFTVERPRTDLPDTFDVNASSGGRLGTAHVAPGQAEVAIALQAAATLRGKLVGSPAPETFRLQLLAPPYTNQSLQFAGDRFEVLDAPAANVHLEVRTSDGRSGKATAMLQPGAAQDVEIVLQEGASVSGRVVDGAQQPIADVVLRLDLEHETTTADGRFKLSSAAGDRTLRVAVQNYKPLQRALSLQPGQALELGDLVLERLTADPGTVGLRLRSDSDMPPTVISVLPGGPAEQGGVRVGDVILAVDGARVSGWSDATQKIRGAPGSPVVLLLKRGSSETTLTLRRAG